MQAQVTSINRELPPLEAATTQAVSLAEENCDLRAEISSLKRRIEKLARENDQLRKHANRKAADARKSRGLWQTERWAREDEARRFKKREKMYLPFLALFAALTVIMYTVIMVYGWDLWRLL